MLNIVSCKIKKCEKFGNLYCAKWQNAMDENKYAYFRFKIVTDDYLTEIDFNNLGGIEGMMTISTKSRLPFETEDVVYFQGAKYNIKRIDGNRKENLLDENAYSMFKNNGNLNTILVLRRAGR